MKYYFFILLVSCPSILIAQKVFGFRYENNGVQIDEIDLASCSSRNVVNLDYSINYLANGGVSQPNNYTRISFDMSIDRKTIVIAAIGTINIIIDGNLVDRFDSKIDITDVDFIEESNSVYIYGRWGGLMNLETFSRQDTFIDPRIWFTLLERPNSIELHECDFYYTGIDGNNIYKSTFNNFDSAEVVLQYSTHPDFFRFLRNPKHIIQYPNCYRSNLVTYSTERGWYRIDFDNSDFIKICDDFESYADLIVMEKDYASFTIPDSCPPIIDLNDDDCDWPNEVNTENNIVCFSDSTSIFGENIKIFSRLSLDSVNISISRPDLFNLVLQENENFRFLTNNDNTYTLHNISYQNSILEGVLESMTLVRNNSDIDISSTEIEISFIPFVNGIEGEESILTLTIQDIINPAAHYLEIETNQTERIDLFNNDQIQKIDWTPDIYLSCSNCISPDITPFADLTYYVQVETTGGCAYTDTVNLTVIPRFPKVYLPNVIYPESSVEMNKYFGILGQNIIDYDLKIFNRSGVLVFDEQNLKPGHYIGWDGRFQGSVLPQGVYVYFIDVKADTRFNQRQTLKGTVTLIR